MSFRILSDKIHRADILRALAFNANTGMLPVHVRQVPILRFILEHDGCTQAEVSEGLGITAQSIAQSAKRLEQVGSITRSADTSNLRCNKLHITEAGKKAVQAADDILQRIETKMFDGFSDDEVQSLSNMLDRIAKNISCGDMDKMETRDLMRMLCSIKNGDKEDDK